MRRAMQAAASWAAAAACKLPVLHLRARSSAAGCRRGGPTAAAGRACRGTPPLSPAAVGDLSFRHMLLRTALMHTVPTTY